MCAWLVAAIWTLAAQNPPAPPQFPPLGTGVSADEKATLQAGVDKLSAKVAALRTKYRTGQMADRVADVEVYLDAVRRPLKYDERLYAGRGSTPVAYALQTLTTGNDARRRVDERADAVDDRERGPRLLFEDRRLGAALHPDDADRTTTRRPSASTVSTSSCTAATTPCSNSSSWRSRRPATRRSRLAAGADRFMLQPYGRYTNASRFAGETDGLEAIESVAKAYPIDRNRIVMTGFSMGGASAWSYIVHFADRWAAGAPGAGFTETEVFLRGGLARQPQNAVQQTLWHLYDSTDYAINTFNVPVVAYSGAIDGQKQAADAMAAAMRGRRADARAHHRPEHRPRVRARGAAAGPGSPGSTGRDGPEPGAEGDSLHDVDAALQQDVLDHGGRDGRALDARARRREDRRRHDPP